MGLSPKDDSAGPLIIDYLYYIASLLNNAISFTKYNNDRVIYMATKILTVSLSKIRTVFANKDTQV